MAEELDPTVVQAVANNNFKALAEGAAYYANIQMADAQASASRRAQAADAAHAVLLKKMAELDAAEAQAIVKHNTGYDQASLSSLITSLGSAVAGLQQIVKTSQTTPPETGK